MCAACGLPTTHTYSFTQIFGLVSLVAFSLITFTWAIWTLAIVKLKKDFSLLVKKLTNKKDGS